MEELIIGREAEIKQLQNSYESKESQLVIVYGRRRVGKTFLINHFFNKRFDFKLTGDFKGDKQVQLDNFYSELKRQSEKDLPQPKDWREAFWQLRDYIDTLSEDEKHVVFFDEMPWLDAKKSGFLPAFEYFWNSYGSAKDNLMFIVCGSATSWMVENIDQNKGGLFNRQSCRIYLEPFNLYETEKYLESKNINWNRYTITQTYMILGGIPYYLKQLDKELTFDANIDNLFFRKRAELWDEYDHLYNTLFSSSVNYTKVVEVLSEKRQGYTRSDIANKTKIADNSKLTKILKNLVDSGFVRSYPYFGKHKQNTFYQLSDYFTLFHFKFVKDNYGTDERFWSNSLDNPSRAAWEGFTFEQVCKDHFRQIKKKIGISGILCSESSWSVPKTEERPGAQIDMLIDRRDKVISICEMKFADSEYQITKDYDEKLRNKMSVFRTVTKTKKALQLVMITTYGLTRGMYSNRVQQQVLLDDLFEDIKF
ncbi:MAG: ATP-binding protein [Spirochaetaceae bacterium]|nr:ATP-binding protein [Spirochaetaceae bacterium]